VARSGAAPRTYQLAIDIARAVRVTVGRLGRYAFPAGRYLYTGSALRGIEARVRRHRSRTKRLHWHIDYLLAAPGVVISGVSTFDAAECAVNQRTPGAIVVAGFGSSDCVCGCGSHLKLAAPAGKGPRSGTA
jgi:Uri superfamily endonuclease